MMYGTGQAREPQSLGRRMSDSVIAAVCTGLMAVLCIGMLWPCRMWDNSGRLGADTCGAHVSALLAKEYPWASSIPFLLLGPRGLS